MQLTYPRYPTLLRASINFSGSGDNTIIAANLTQRICIYRLWLVGGAATNITFKDNLVSPGAIPMAANGGITFDLSGEPWFITDVNTAFIINSSSGTQISGICHYLLTK